MIRFILNCYIFVKKKFMLSVNGIYDGNIVRLTDNFSDKRKYRVVVTFIEEIQENEELIRDFSAQTNALDFLEDPREDLYQDYLKSKPE